MSRLWPLLLVAVACSAACSGRASESECARAADHMIDIMTAPPIGESGSPSADAVKASAAWTKTFKAKDPTRGTIIDTCRTRMNGGHVSCILEAVDERSLARCFAP